MADRDKYGNYVNDKGVTIKINTDNNDVIQITDNTIIGLKNRQS